MGWRAPRRFRGRHVDCSTVGSMLARAKTASHDRAVSYRAFVSEVAQRAGAQNMTEVEQTVLATLMALGERLRDVDARAVAEHLPISLGAPILSARHARDHEA